MNTILHNTKTLTKVAGTAAFIGGVLVPVSFILPGGNLETAQIYGALLNGEHSINEWGKQLSTNGFREVALYLSVMSMFLILLTSLVLFKLIDQLIWQKYVALSGYLLSCILAAFIFIYRLGTEKTLLNELENNSNLSDHILHSIYLQDGLFQMVHTHFVPIVMVFFGTFFMAWALLRSGMIPQWLSLWGLTVSALVGLGGLSIIIPPAKLLLQVTPLHFLWFVALGLFLLLKIKSVKN